MAKRTISFEERFWNSVEFEPNSGCWLWSGAADIHGYGRIKLGARHTPVCLAHRVSWEMAHGAIPAGLKVLHRCDTPACVNPAHLFLGTQADNMADMIAKGRAHHPGTARGAINGNSKLTEAVVMRIRALSRDGETAPQIAARFDINKETVGRIIRRESWKHVE